MYEEYFKWNNSDKLLNKLAKSKKRVVFYGAGIFAQEFFSLYDFSSLNVVGISDKKFEESGSKIFCGVKAYKPSELETLDFDVLFIIVYQSTYIESLIKDEPFYKRLIQRQGKVIKLDNPEKLTINKIFGKSSNENCLMCGSNGLKSFYGIITLFLKDFMFNNKYSYSEMLCCPKCKVSYFKLRPNEEEVNRYYERYQNEEYNALRNKYEPGYDEIIKLHLELSSRKKYFKRDMIIIENEWDKLSKVLDYGGSGDFFDEIVPNASKFIYDKAPKKDKENIKIINNLDEFNNYFNFIMCTQVLEHVSYPNNTIKEIYEKLAPGGYTYISVPNEKGCSCDTSLFNRLKRINDPFVMHEHINIFKPETLEIMMKNAGFKIIKCKYVKYKKKYCYEGHIYILAQK